MKNLDTINRGNHIISYDFLDEYDETFYDNYEPLDFEEEEINYDESWQNLKDQYWGTYYISTLVLKLSNTRYIGRTIVII